MAKFGRGLVALHACWSAALVQLLPISSVPHGQKCLVNQCPSCICLGWPGVTLLLHGLEIKSMCFVCLCDSVTFSCCGGDGKIRQRLGSTARLLVSSSCTAAAHFIGATWAEVSSQPVPQLHLPWLAWCYGASTWARNQIYVLSVSVTP